MMATDAMVTTEVEQLHVEFEEWFQGRSASLAGVEAALGEEFTFVGTTGTVIDRSGVLGFLQSAKGSGNTSIRIEKVVVRWRRGDLVGATYEEWQSSTQDGMQQTTGRVSSAVFELDETAPRSLRWLSVHETWLPGHAP